jgi:hypothetical protein
VSEPRPRALLLAGLALATAVVGWPLLLPVTYDTHDGHYALYNAAQFDRALRDGEIPVRWLPDLHGGRGLPVFLYYHPLAFYVVSGLHALGLGLIASMRVLVLATLPLSGLAMAAWLRRSLPPLAAAVGGIAYLLAPYRAVEIHVKGDPPAALAFVFLPLVLLAAERASVLGLAFASAGLVLAHSVTALLVLPAAAAWAMLALPRGERGRPAAHVAAGTALGAALSAFHWVPALAEKGLVRVDSREGILFFDFRDHFLVPWQWLSPLWGYHGSFAGTADDMAFQIGPVHAVGLVAAAALVSSATPPRARRLAGWAVAVAVAALLLTLSLTSPLWEAMAPLRYVQFPWRTLALVALATSGALAAALAGARRPDRLLAAVALAPAAITLGFAAAHHHRLYLALGAGYGAVGLAARGLPQHRGRRLADVPVLVAGLMLAVALPWSAVPLHARLKGEPAVVPLGEGDLAPARVALGQRRTTARHDYLPRTVIEAPPLDPAQEYLPPPRSRPAEPLTVLEGTLRRARVSRDSGSLVLAYDADAPARVALELHAFPGWKATAAGRAVPYSIDPLGRIVVDLPAGAHVLELRWGRTPLRRLADAVTAAGVLAAILLAGARRRRGAPAPGRR